MKHVFIINPAAGKGKSLKAIPQIRKAMAERNLEYCIEVTEGPGHATAIALQYASADRCRLYSVGGDGTLNEVLNGAVHTNSGLAVIPCGSGNDFIRSILGKEPAGYLLERTIDGQEQEIDLARVNGRYFVNIASIGFDAEVVYNTIKLKKLPFISGSLAYILGILDTLLRYKNCTMEFTLEGNRFLRKSLLVAVANGRYYGGGMVPVPGACLDDGTLDICLVEAISRVKILQLFPMYMKGRHGVIREVSFHKGQKLEVKCERELALNVDGEIERVKEAVFEIVPGGIRIVMPELFKNYHTFSGVSRKML